MHFGPFLPYFTLGWQLTWLSSRSCGSSGAYMGLFSTQQFHRGVRVDEAPSVFLLENVLVNLGEVILQN